ncbi:MAG: DUF2796 domain-containing protein [Zoogloeaceae bacterium]|jgi:hypothetical protein|nr:DUF2796 domain-containing protein [Zoogloeaceae bacterium]
MKSFIFTVLLIACFASASVRAQHDHDAHVHGAAHLDVVVDGAVLSLQLESPLDNLLGFEHEPRNKAERDKVTRMAAKLREAAKLFTPTPEAACKPEQTRLVSSALTPELLGERAAEKQAAHAEAEEEEEEGHADLDASWQFRCARPEALRGVDVRLFQVFSGIREIEAQVAGPRGQHGARLTPDKRILTW